MEFVCFIIYSEKIDWIPISPGTVVGTENTAYTPVGHINNKLMNY